MQGLLPRTMLLSTVVQLALLCACEAGRQLKEVSPPAAGAGEVEEEALSSAARAVERLAAAKPLMMLGPIGPHDTLTLADSTSPHTPKPPPKPPKPPPPSPPITLNVDWSVETRRTSTAATVEVDVMPFLARQPATDPFVSTHYGGPFEKYYAALSNLNASYVRFAPWCPNPRLVVPELTPPDCTATKPASNWNSVGRLDDHRGCPCAFPCHLFPSHER